MKANDIGFERFSEDFHADIKTAFIKTDDVKVSIGVACIVCGESVELTDNECLALSRGHNIESKVCDKCKEAIIYMRKQIEKE